LGRKKRVITRVERVKPSLPDEQPLQLGKKNPSYFKRGVEYRRHEGEKGWIDPGGKVRGKVDGNGDHFRTGLQTVKKREKKSSGAVGDQLVDAFKQRIKGTTTRHGRKWGKNLEGR